MFRKIFMVVTILALSLAACTFKGKNRSSGPITLTDGLGHPVTLKEPAKRIISLAPSNTEILFAIGAGTQLVGRDETSDYPAEAAAITTIGGWGGFSSEAIVALEPDLVLGMAGDFNSPELAASLEQLGLTVYYLPNPATIEDMFNNIKTVGELTGRSSEAAALIKTLQKRVKAVDDKIINLSYRPVVFFEIDASNPASPYTTGAGTFIDGMITRAGGQNAGSRLSGAWTQMSVEELLVLNPAVIILADSKYGETPEKVAQRPGWETLKAVQAGNVFPIDDNLVVRQGPRLVDGLEALARLLHPDVFK
jgi:iron complex transport system substrate-binding protein